MQKIINSIKRNKIALFIGILFVAIYYIVYSNFELNRINASIIETKAKNAYILVTEWISIIKRQNDTKIIRLGVKEKKDIMLHDKIRTMWDSSATIFWPDWSITRLWSKTSITINEMASSDNLSTYKVNFNLETGKTWSNIIKFITDDSYFTETYDDWNYAATARWTIFEINLDNNYINAYSHDITLENTDEKVNYNIKQWEIVNAFDPTSTASELNIDKEWIDQNINEDKIYIDSLYKQWQNKVSEINKKQTIWTKTVSYLKYTSGIGEDSYITSKLNSSLVNWNTNIISDVQKLIPQLSTDKKQKLNQELLWLYENIHSLPNSSDISNYKSNIRDLIIQTSNKWKELDNLKQKFLKLNIYDYAELAKNKWAKWATDLKNNIMKQLDEIKDPAKIEELLWSFSWDILWVLKYWFNNIQHWINNLLEKTREIKMGGNLKEDIISKWEQLKKNAWDFIWNIKNKIWN